MLGLDAASSSFRWKPQWLVVGGVSIFWLGVIFCNSEIGHSLLQLGHEDEPLASADGNRKAISHLARKQSLISAAVGSKNRHGLSDEELRNLNERIEALDVGEQPLAVLKWADANLPEGKWAQVSSFGLTGIAIMNMLYTLGKLDHVPVVTVDTLHLFPESYQLIEGVKKFFKLKTLHVYRTNEATTREGFEKSFGPSLWRADPSLFDYVTKVEPMQRALDDLGMVAWITGRRRSQGGDRTGVQLFEADPADGRLKLNPMANWNKVSARIQGTC